jgi:hypothetical protein
MHYYTNHGKATLVENVKVTIHFVCEALVQSHIFIRSFNKLFDIMCTYIKNIDYYISYYKEHIRGRMGSLVQCI